MNRKVDAGPCRYAQIDADVEMEASPAQILDALFANEGQIVTHTGRYINIFFEPGLFFRL